MNKAEQKRWSTLSNYMMAISYVKTMYPKCILSGIIYEEQIHLQCLIPVAEYNTEELANDISRIAEEDANITVVKYDIRVHDIINIEWRLEPYDN